jgi:signal transduction histidine kinase
MDKNPIQVIAEVLPKMMQAVLAAPRSQESQDKPLGGITSEIARYLNAEICSIFRVDESGNKLSLTEAHGYHQNVINASHDLDKGLTGRIFKEKIELILNYCVQDPDLGWAGRFDPDLQAHCWSLLGVPIMSHHGTKCYGVLKFENKRSGWSSLENGRYLTSIIPVQTGNAGTKKRICTPKMIKEMVQSSQILSRHMHICNLAKELAEHVGNISYLKTPNVPADSVFAEKIASLSQEKLKTESDSIKWYANSLHHEIDQLVNTEEDSCVKFIKDITHAFRLCLDIYIPFSEDDFHLAKALAEIIGMSLDASETARARALEMVRHGIKNVTAQFLGHVDILYKETVNSEIYPKISLSLKHVYTSALELTSSCSTATQDTERGIDLVSEKFGDLYETILCQRLDFHKNYSKLYGIDFDYPEPNQLSNNLSNAEVDCDMGVVVGVLDGLIVNSIKHAEPKKITLSISENDGNLEVTLLDIGKGMDEETLSAIKNDRSTMPFSESGGFGLRAYKMALQESGCVFEIDSTLGEGTKAKIIMKININSRKSR